MVLYDSDQRIIESEAVRVLVLTKILGHQISLPIVVLQFNDEYFGAQIYPFEYGFHQDDAFEEFPVDQ